MMRHTIKRIQNRIIKECEPQSHYYRNELIVEKYHNPNTEENFEIVYDHDTVPLEIKNLSTGLTWSRGN